MKDHTGRKQVNNLISRKGKERFSILNLLFEHPMSDYIIREKDRKALNVLLIGDLGEDSIRENKAINNEIFKAVFSCGQYPDCILNISIVSTNADKLKEDFFLDNNDDSTLLHELRSFIEQKKYANLFFEQASTVGSLFDISQIVQKRLDYRYVVINTGNPKNDIEISDIIQNKMPDAFAWVYEDFLGIEEPENTELFRIAGNINFSYTIEFDETFNAEESMCAFKKEFNEEYATNAFTEKKHKYDVDSSLFCAAHIPYKLKYCKEYAREKGEEKQAQQILIDAVNNNNILFKKLMGLEHRRWNAYMLIRGYHYPSENEIEQICKDGVVHKNPADLWHICLCDSSENGTALKNKSINYWNQKYDYNQSRLSELDQASLLYYQKASERVDEYAKDIKKGKLLDAPYYAELRTAIKRMINNQDIDSVVQFEGVRQFLEEKKKVLIPEKVNDLILAVKERNQRRDFYDTDAYLIRMLPFCIWYGRDYHTVITVTNGNALEDIQIPTLICASKAIYLVKESVFGDQESRERYEHSIGQYFEKRGENTSPSFINIYSKDTKTLVKDISNIIQSINSPKGIVLSSSEQDSIDTISAITTASIRYQIPHLQYDRFKGLVTHSDEEFCTAIDNKNLSIEELMKLNNRSIINIGDNPFSSKQQWILEEGLKSPSNWNKCIQVLQKKENHPYKHITRLSKTNSIPMIKRMRFSNDVVWENCIGNFVEDLIKYNVIRLVSGWKNDEKTLISSIDIEFYDEELFEILDEYSVEKYDTGQFKRCNLELFLNKDNHRIEIREQLLGTPHLIFGGETKSNEQLQFISFLESLERADLINYNNDEKNKTISYFFKDRRIMSFFMKEGNAFELLVYFRLKNTGLFKYVGIGVQSALDTYLDFMGAVKKEMEDQKIYGFRNLQNVVDMTAEKTEIVEQRIDEREIDIVAMYKMTPILISCKAKTKFDEKDVNEISVIANQLNAKAILCVTTKPKWHKLHETDVSIMDIELINDSVRFRNALEAVLTNSKE